MQVDGFENHWFLSKICPNLLLIIQICEALQLGAWYISCKITSGGRIGSIKKSLILEYKNFRIPECRNFGIWKFHNCIKWKSHNQKYETWQKIDRLVENRVMNVNSKILLLTSSWCAWTQVRVVGDYWTECFRTHFTRNCRSRP